MFPRVFCFPKSRINENGGKTCCCQFFVEAFYSGSLSANPTKLIELVNCYSNLLNVSTEVGVLALD